jgi:hypothetical protein
MKSTRFVLLASTLFFAAAPALADEDAQSRAYFETGAKAYEKGDYQNAIRAFDQAYALTKRPGLIFSSAQSYKRQYAVDSNPTNLRKALEYYRRFLTEDKSGKRRGDATSAIMEIEGILARLPAEQQAAAAGIPEAAQPTQISVTTQVDDAMVSIDGSAPHTLEPVEVKPGKHKVVIQAKGYFPEERELFASEKQMTAIDVPLRAMPATVTVDGRIGAMVTVDGTPKGTLPLLGPLEIDAGERTIAVTRAGFVTFSREYALGRGTEAKIKADLPRTGQRIASFIMFGTGIVFAGGGVLAALGSAGAYGQGIQTYNTQQKKGKFITAAELDDYIILQAQQSSANIGAAALFSMGAASGALGFLLYYFDDPKIPTAKPKKDEGAPPKKDQSPGLHDMMLAPAASPGFAGMSFSAKF